METTKLTKLRTAIALAYDNSMRAPEVSTQLTGIHAEQCIKNCSRYGIPVVQNSVLVDKLKLVPVTAEIPENLYKEIAQTFISIGELYKR